MPTGTIGSIHSTCFGRAKSWEVSRVKFNPPEGISSNTLELPRKKIALKSIMNATIVNEKLS